MAAGLGHSEVKSICDSLEVSPSAKDDGKPFSKHPSVTVGGRSATSSTRLSTPESELQLKRNSGSIPGFVGKFARRARNE